MPQSQVNPLLQFLPILFIFGIFYFMIIRPQRQRDKDLRKLQDGLKKNDEVVTTAGIHGTVVSVKDRTVMIRIDENVKMEVEKNCIAFQKSAQGASQNQ